MYVIHMHVQSSCVQLQVGCLRRKRFGTCMLNNAAVPVIQYCLIMLLQCISSSTCTWCCETCPELLLLTLLLYVVQLGFTNTMGYCYQGPSFLGCLTGGYSYPLCANPNEYIFWDPVHPTKHVHALLAQDFMNTFPQLNQNNLM